MPQFVLSLVDGELVEIPIATTPTGAWGDGGWGSGPWTGEPSPIPQGTPTFVPQGTTFTVVQNYQTLFSSPIDVEGLLVLDGLLIEVT